MSNIHNPHQLSQVSASELAYQDCAIKSGIDPETYRQASDIAGTQLLPEHLQDWLNSGVDREIIRLNVHSVRGAELFEILHPKATATQSGTGVRRGDREKLDICLESAGWECNGRVKPTSGPLTKAGKYLSASGGWVNGEYVKTPSKLTFLRVPLHIWQRVAERYGVVLPEHPVLEADGAAIGFWEWVRDNNIPIVLEEGEKKAGCLLSRGYAAVSLPGIWMGRRVVYGEIDGKRIGERLHEDLLEFDTPGREIIIAFDWRAGNYFEAVEFKAASATAKLVQNAIAKIAQLPGPDKGADDFCVAGGDINAVIREASQQTSDDWQLKKWQRFRGFSPDIKINSRYFDAPAPESGKITAVRSGLGTGKTHWIGEKIASDTRGLQINLGYRNSLLLQQCEKWGSYHFDEHHGWRHIKDPDARLSLCVDSLLKLPIEMFESAVENLRGLTIIIDEPVSVLKHLILSRTLLGKRVETLERLEIVCKLADRIVLTDGNLSNLVVDYFAEISGKPVTRIENTFTGESPPIFFVDAGKKSKKRLSAEVLKSPCPAIATDSLRDAEAFARQLSESHGPGILLTSKTAPTEDMKELLKDPDAWIKKYKPAWIVFTPTAESGIDISIRDYFSDMFCWFVGVVGVDECVQMSRRVRHPERIIILSPERGLASRSTGGIFEADIIKALAEFGDTEARLLVGDESQLQKVREDVAAQIVNPHTILWAKLQAKAELERLHLREYLLKAFEAGGYSVQQVSAADCDYEGHAIAKEECKDIEAQEIFNAPDIELAEALEIKLNFKATWDDRCKAIKFFLKARLPGIEDSDLWTWQFVRRVRFDERSLLSQLDAAWQFDNPEDAEYLQRSRLLAGKREFLGDFSNRYLKIRTLQALGLEKFLDSSKDWSGNDFEVVELYERCKKKVIANLLGHPGKMKPMQWLNQLLSLIGCKLIGRRTKQNGVLHRTYSFDDELSTPANWDELAAFTAQKQAKKISELKEAELLAAQALEAVPPPPVFDTNLGVGGSIPGVKAEPPIKPPIANQTGWVSRWGKWVAAKVIGWCENGTRYRILYQTKCGEWDEALAFPSYMRWDAPT